MSNPSSDMQGALHRRAIIFFIFLTIVAIIFAAGAAWVIHHKFAWDSQDGYEATFFTVGVLLIAIGTVVILAEKSSQIVATLLSGSVTTEEKKPDGDQPGALSGLATVLTSIVTGFTEIVKGGVVAPALILLGAGSVLLASLYGGYSVDGTTIGTPVPLSTTAAVAAPKPQSTAAQSQGSTQPPAPSGTDGTGAPEQVPPDGLQPTVPSGT